jgi:Protein phosphatase 2C
MTEAEWKWIGASVLGTSHRNTGTECQDNHRCEQIQSREGPILVALVSDGAGSATKSAEGSRLICEVLQEQADQYFVEDGCVKLLNQRLIASWVNIFRDEVILQASAEGISERDFACTLVGAIVSSTAAAFFQIGDGAIVYSSEAPSEYLLGFWPDRGEYENTTYFATQANFLEQLNFTLVEDRILEAALLSDGLQRLALDYQTQRPHPQFFGGLFPAIRKSAPSNLPRLEQQLSEYLDSPRINERTDDDKTLVLAVRCGPDAQEKDRTAQCGLWTAPAKRLRLDRKWGEAVRELSTSLPRIRRSLQKSTINLWTLLAPTRSAR